MIKKLFRFLLTMMVSSSAFYPALATHLAGQDFTYILVDSSGGVYHYRVSLDLYQDCYYASPNSILADNPAFFSVYNGAGTLIQLDTTIYYSAADSLSANFSGLCAGGQVTIRFCRERKKFTKDYYLPASPSGYTIVYQRCCLNPVTNIVDGNDQGITATCNIPSSGIATHNNSAIFSNYPPFIIAMNSPLTFDCSATDADGDSLSYLLCNIYDGVSDANIKPYPAAPPFAPEIYTAPLSYTDPLNCSASLAIDPVTGRLTGTPDAAGLYLIAVCCEEWRHKVLVNTVQRVFEFTVVNCTAATPLLPKIAAFDFHPNPITNQLFIEHSATGSQIRIFNALGVQVYSGVITQDKELISTEGFLAGCYLLQLTDINGNRSERTLLKE